MKAYEEFEESFFGSGRADRDGPNLSLLHRLSRSEMDLAEIRILEELNGRDSDLVEALGIIGTKRSVKALRQVLRNGDGVSRVASLWALWMIDSDENALADLIGLSQRRLFVSRLVRQLAVRLLSTIDDRRVRKSLVKHIVDSDPLISGYAVRGLLKMYGLNDLLEITEARFFSVHLRDRKAESGEHKTCVVRILSEAKRRHDF